MSKPLRSTLLAVSVVLSVGSMSVVSAEESTQPARERLRSAAETVLVELQPGASLPGVLRLQAGAVIDGWVELPVPEGKSVEQWEAELGELPGVVAVERPVLFKLFAPPITINDPLFSYQWHMDLIQLPEALEVATGVGVVVAVVDSGVSRGPDGFCRPFVNEFDAYRNVAGPGQAFDNNGHGTHVAGTIAQCTGNGIGVAGVAPDSTIMPIAVFDDSGMAPSPVIARAVDWARTHGAHVINLSLGCTGDDCYSQVLNDAIDRAIRAGIVVVAAAGNDGGAVAYPARLPGVIAVGAAGWSVGDSLYRRDYSNLGAQLYLLAPGGDTGVGVVQETLNGGIWDYYAMWGTSMAAPHVSGAAALLLSRGARPGEIRTVLRCSADGNRHWSRSAGFGNLQLGSAIDFLAGARAGDHPMDCDSSEGLALVDRSTGYWVLTRSVGETGSQKEPIAEFYFGNPGDSPFTGDWDCDGVDTPGLYRRSDGYVYLRNSNTQGIADISFFFGNPGDMPLAGDFNGDGCDTVSIYRPSEGRFYIINELGSSDGGLGAADFAFYFGVVGDQPFVGDFDADGIDTVGLHRGTTGLVYYRNSLTTGVADHSFIWGDPGDQVFVFDVNGDGIDTVGLYRWWQSPGPWPNTFWPPGVFYRGSNTQGPADNNVAVDGWGSFGYTNLWRFTVVPGQY